MIPKGIPKHVAIVMDGNGRWAEQRGLRRGDGHRAGIESVKAVVRSCLKHHIPVLSLFAFSSENWSRPPDEVNALMTLFFEALTSEVDDLIENGVQLRFTGEKNRFLPELQQLMTTAEEKTAVNEKLILNICINYGGQWDLVQAMQTICSLVEEKRLSSQQINEQLVSEHLATYPLSPPDLFIRTSGEHRISNFFLWQIAYTELYFSDVLWPDFNEQVFDDALRSFAKRERRFGLVSSEQTA